MECELRNMFSTETPNPINYSTTTTTVLLERNNPSRKYFSEEIAIIRHELLRWVIDNQSKSIDSVRVTVNENDKLSIITNKHDKYFKSFTETGCSEMCFPVPASLIDYKNDGHRTEHNSTVTVKMLFDWERLWKHLAYDPTDNLAEHATLLRACIRFFMHENSIRIYWGLLLYNSATDLWYFSSVSNAQLENTVLVLFRRTIYGIFYNALRRLFVDEQLERNIEQKNNVPPGIPRNEPHRQTSVAIQSTPHYYKMHWLDALRHYSSTIFSEIRSVINCTSTTTGTSSSSSSMTSATDLSREIATSFVSLVNIALKYIHQHCDNDIETINKKTSYVRAFRSIIFVLPFYCIGYLITTIIDNVDACSNNSNECQNLIILSVLRLGYLTDAVFLYLHNGSILVSVIGLTYATMLAYHMMRCWMKRYAGLRKLRFDLNTINSEGRRIHSTQIGQSNTTPTSDIEGRKSIEEDTIVESSTDIQLRDLSTHLQTDATEQYLFVVEYMRQSGVVWSPVITWMYLYAIIMLLSIIYVIVIASYNGATIDKDMSLILSTSSVEILLFVIFPTWSLSHVNSLIGPMRELFTIAAQEDFAIIGVVIYKFLFILRRYFSILCLFIRSSFF